MHKTKSTAIRIIILISIIILILFLTNSYIIYGMTNEKFAIINNINNMNDTDVVIVGNSHAQEGIDSKLLSNITNKKFFNFSFSQQESAAAYYFVNKIIKKNKPEIIILEAYSLIQQMEGAYDLMPFSIDKMKYYKMLKDELDFTTTFFPIFRFHNCWTNENCLTTIIENFNSTDITPVFQAEIMSEKAITRHMEFDSENLAKDLKANRFDNITEIKRLCDEKGIKLVMIMMPWYKTLVDKISYKELYYSPIKKLCDDNEIPYFDMNIESDKDWDYYYFREQDYTQNTHLNAYGQYQASCELANYLDSNFENIITIKDYPELTKLRDYLSTIDSSSDIVVIDKCPTSISKDIFLSVKEEFKRLGISPLKKSDTDLKIQYISGGVQYNSFDNYENLGADDLAINIYEIDSETKEIISHAVTRWDVFDTVFIR